MSYFSKLTISTTVSSIIYFPRSCGRRPSWQPPPLLLLTPVTFYHSSSIQSSSSSSSALRSRKVFWFHCFPPSHKSTKVMITTTARGGTGGGDGGGNSHWNHWILLVEILVSVFIGYFILPDLISHYFWFATIRGHSMYPTLHGISGDADYVFLNKWAIRNLSTVERGKVYAMVDPEDESQLVIKRLIGLYPDVVKTLDSHENYIAVPPGHCWVEGDNHGAAIDSHSYGPVPIGLIIAEVPCVIWPVQRSQWLQAKINENRYLEDQFSGSSSSRSRYGQNKIPWWRHQYTVQKQGVEYWTPEQGKLTPPSPEDEGIRPTTTPTPTPSSSSSLSSETILPNGNNHTNTTTSIHALGHHDPRYTTISCENDSKSNSSHNCTEIAQQPQPQPQPQQQHSYTPPRCWADE